MGGAGDHHLLGDQAVGDAELLGGVVDADVHSLFGRALISPLRQPHRQPGAAARRVDDEVGFTNVDRIVTRTQQHTGHPLSRSVEPRLLHGATHDLHVVDVAHPFAQLPFQMRPAGHVCGEFLAQGMPGPQDVPRGAEVDAVGPVFQHGHARGRHVFQQARKKVVELDRPAGHQHVQMLVLGHRRAVCRCARQLVALENRHPAEKVRKHPRSTQSGDARPDDDRVLPRVCSGPAHPGRVPSTVRS